MEYDPVRICKALSNKSRMDILEAIYKRGMCGTFKGKTPTVEKCSCVGDIVEEFQLAPSTISHHLKELAMAGLIEVDRDGQFVRVSPNVKALEALVEWSNKLLEEVKAKR